MNGIVRILTVAIMAGLSCASWADNPPAGQRAQPARANKAKLQAWQDYTEVLNQKIGLTDQDKLTVDEAAVGSFSYNKPQSMGGAGGTPAVPSKEIEEILLARLSGEDAGGEVKLPIKMPKPCLLRGNEGRGLFLFMPVHEAQMQRYAHGDRIELPDPDGLTLDFGAGAVTSAGSQKTGDLGTFDAKKAARIFVHRLKPGYSVIVEDSSGQCAFSLNHHGDKPAPGFAACDRQAAVFQKLDEILGAGSEAGRMNAAAAAHMRPRLAQGRHPVYEDIRHKIQSMKPEELRQYLNAQYQGASPVTDQQIAQAQQSFAQAGYHGKGGGYWETQRKAGAPSFYDDNGGVRLRVGGKEIPLAHQNESPGTPADLFKGYDTAAAAKEVLAVLLAGNVPKNSASSTTNFAFNLTLPFMESFAPTPLLGPNASAARSWAVAGAATAPPGAAGVRAAAQDPANYLGVFGTIMPTGKTMSLAKRQDEIEQAVANSKARLERETAAAEAGDRLEEVKRKLAEAKAKPVASAQQHYQKAEDIRRLEAELGRAQSEFDTTTHKAEQYGGKEDEGARRKKENLKKKYEGIIDKQVAKLRKPGNRGLLQAYVEDVDTTQAHWQDALDQTLKGYFEKFWSEAAKANSRDFCIGAGVTDDPDTVTQCAGGLLKAYQKAAKDNACFAKPNPEECLKNMSVPLGAPPAPAAPGQSAASGHLSD